MYDEKKIEAYKFLSILLANKFDVFYKTPKLGNKIITNKLSLKDDSNVLQIDPIFKELKKFRVQELTNYSHALQSANIVIVTYPQTTVFDLVYLDIPFVMFLEPEEWDLTRISMNWYDKFCSFGLAYRYSEYKELYTAILNKKIVSTFYSKEFRIFRKEFLDFIT